MLPQLQRDSMSQKNVFYVCEKLIVKNFSSAFPYQSAQKIKDSLNLTNDYLQRKVLSGDTVVIKKISNLINNQVESDEIESEKIVVAKAGIRYIFAQFSEICKLF